MSWRAVAALALLMPGACHDPDADGRTCVIRFRLDLPPERREPSSGCTKPGTPAAPPPRADPDRPAHDEGRIAYA